MTNEPTLYRIPEPRMAELLLRLEKLNKRARKLGTQPVEITEVDRERKTVMKDGKPTGEVRTTLILTFEGEQPILNGWAFLAKIEPLDGANLIQCVPFADLEGVDLTPYRTTAMDCHHCNFNRRRSSTFLVRNVESQKIMLVGRSCLKDFTGHQSPEYILGACQYLLDVAGMMDSFEEDGWGSGSFERIADPVTFLAWTRRAIAQWGWTSKGKARDTDKSATVSDVSFMLFPPAHAESRKVSEAMRDDVGAPTEEDTQAAEAALGWARDLEPGENSDYLWNIKVLAGTEGWAQKHFGLGGSIMMAYQRTLDQAEEDARRAEAAPSKHVGDVKERLTLTVTVLDLRRMDNEWNTLLVKMADGEGNMFSWFASEGSAAEDWSKGETLTIKATVKGHTEYRGVLETQVNRCKAQKVAA